MLKNLSYFDWRRVVSALANALLVAAPLHCIQGKLAAAGQVSRDEAPRIALGKQLCGY